MRPVLEEIAADAEEDAAVREAARVGLGMLAPGSSTESNVLHTARDVGGGGKRLTAD